MRSFDAVAVAAALPYAELIDALESAFRVGATVPLRTRHIVERPQAVDATLLLMPAWQNEMLGVKIVNVFPDNAARGLGAVNASYILMQGDTGVPLAVLDGDELTVRRTACASALASRLLSRADAQTLLMVGTGRLAPHLIAAHAAVRPLRRIRIWGRNPQRADALVAQFADSDADVEAARDLGVAAADADIISCATLAEQPLIFGSDLRPGQHLDLVGAFTPQMAEADPDCLRRSRVFVDTYAGTDAEAGDILQAIAAGAIARKDVRAELRELVSGEAAGRQSERDITLFKSVGTALEDLAAAALVWRNAGTT